MKTKFLLFIILLSIYGFQNGCSKDNNSNQSSVNNQNSSIVSASPTVSPPNPTPSSNPNAKNNGISSEEDKRNNNFRERCKHAPVGKAKATPLTGTAPLKVTFDDNGSKDPDGTKIVKWKWHFGNGESSEGKTTTYIYETPGNYRISLDVTDSQGQKTSDCSDMGTGVFITVTENTNEKTN